MKSYGVTFNEWNIAYHDYGLEWLEDQLMVLQIAVDNAYQVEEHNATPEPEVPIGEWRYKG